MEIRFWYYDRRTGEKRQNSDGALRSTGMYVVHQGLDVWRAQQMVAFFVFSLLEEDEQLVVLEPVSEGNRAAFIQHIEQLHKNPLCPLRKSNTRARGFVERFLRTWSMREALHSVAYDSLSFVCETREEMVALMSRIKHGMFYCISKKKATPFDIRLEHQKGYRRLREDGSSEPVCVGNDLWIIVNPRDCAVEIQSERLSVVFGDNAVRHGGATAVRVLRG